MKKNITIFALLFLSLSLSAEPEQVDPSKSIFVSQKDFDKADGYSKFIENEANLGSDRDDALVDQLWPYSYELKTITDDSLQATLDTEVGQARYRMAKQWAIVGASLAITYGLVSMHQYMIKPDWMIKAGTDALGNLKTIPLDQNFVNPATAINFSDKNLPNLVAQKALQMSQSVAYGTMDFTKSIAKWVVGMAPSVIGGTILSVSSNQIMRSFNQCREMSHISGFMKYNTKFFQLSEILQESAVPFDIYSDRLSLDANFHRQRVQFSQLIDRLDNNQGSSSRQVIYGLNQYRAESGSAAELEKYALYAVGYKKRSESGSIDSDDELEHLKRLQLVELANGLIQETQRIIAFMIYKIGGVTTIQDLSVYADGKLTIDYLIKITNNFSAVLQDKLSLHLSQMHQLGLSGNGIFDLIYEYTHNVQSACAGADILKR